MASTARIAALEARHARTSASGLVHCWEVRLRDNHTGAEITVEADVAEGARDIIERAHGNLSEYVCAQVQARANIFDDAADPLGRLRAEAPVQIHAPPALDARDTEGVADRLDAISSKLQSAHAELDAVMEQRRTALKRLSEVHKDRLEANRRAEEGADRDLPGSDPGP